MNMSKLIVFWLALLLLALNCRASEPIQLSGISGQTILAQIASTNITFELPQIDDDNVWLATKSAELGLKMNEYT